MPFVQHDPRRLVWQQNDRYLWIEPWGENSLRVRSGRHLPVMRNEDWALTEPVAESHCHIDYEHHQATLTNGKIIAIVNQKGQVTFYRHPHKPLLQEFWRLRGEIGEDESSHGQYVSRPIWISKDACSNWPSATLRPRCPLCSQAWATDFYGTIRRSAA